MSVPVYHNMYSFSYYTGEISTEPSVDEVKHLLLTPLHMMTQSLVSCVHPLTGPDHKPAQHGQSRTVSQASTLVTMCTDAANEDQTPVHRRGGSQDQENMEEKQQVFTHIRVVLFIVDSLYTYVHLRSCTLRHA